MKIIVKNELRIRYDFELLNLIKPSCAIVLVLLHGCACNARVILQGSKMGIVIPYHVIIISQLNDLNLMRCYIIRVNQL